MVYFCNNKVRVKIFNFLTPCKIRTPNFSLKIRKKCVVYPGNYGILFNIYPRCLTVEGWIVVYKMFGLAIAVTSAIEDLWLEMM